MNQKTINEVMSEMGKRRWRGKSKSEISAHMKRMSDRGVAARQEKRRNKAKNMPVDKVVART